MLKIIDLNFKYNHHPLITNLNLEVKKGEKIAIIGPSGCGKSTILRLIMGLIKPDSGQIIIEGEDITKLSEKHLKRIRLKLGMLFQSAALFDSLTVEENVAFSLVENFKLPRAQIQCQVKEKLALVEMENTQKLMPSDLSGGMRKRIGLARAIAHEPQIMLYDEPTTGLDPVLSSTIEELIVKLASKLQITSIVVTHQISTMLKTADKIYYMKNGQLLPAQTPQSILSCTNPTICEFIKTT
jgi:phospholipid/cholesterol/gamma-HCH transport system ATP-binding protein